VLVLAVLFLLAFQYGLVREEDLGVLSSSLPSSSVRGGASNTVDNIKATSGTNDACPQASHLAKPIVLDFKEIKATDNQRLNDVKGFTEPSYEQIEFFTMAHEQDVIGWRRFMEGMVCVGMRRIQSCFSEVGISNREMTSWSCGLITKLLEATHGQWLYRCVQTHDTISGTNATMRKEQLQREIERQLDMDIGEDWEREDRYLAEVNLEDLESTSGANQEYWLLAIRTAREASRLRQIQQTQHHSGTNT